MPSITQQRIKLVNPGRRRRVGNPRKRNMSLKQLLHFGTKRQRTSAKARLHRKRTVKRNPIVRVKVSNPRKRYTYARSNPKRRKRNVGTILTVLPATLANPAKRRRRVNRSNKGKRRINPKMARATRKQLSALRKARAARRRNLRGGSSHRRRRNPGVRRHRRRSNPVMAIATRRRRRRSNPIGRRRRHYSVARRRHYRRNPGMSITGGTTGRVLGVIGGATLTKLLVGFVPAQFTTGFLGYIAIGAVAYLQGKAVGKVMKNPSLGQDFLTGGLVYLAIKMLNDFIPSLGGNLGLSGGRGMGLIAPSSFYLPQVNQMNSMGQFVRPSAVPAPYMPPATVAGMHGMGNVRRTGRVR